ncbi:MAG: beta-(1-6) glucans synthase [Xanthobacteraceae bacterium]|nr:beta-(1-6) glucans synthase [Xanthobacteraceae bacterium]
MRIAVTLFVAVAAVIAAVWSWLGASVEMPQAPAGAPGRLDCVSYAPFRGDQNPLGPGTVVEPWQIEQDLAQLKPLTSCIRTYSIDHGLDKIPEIARRHGMKVLHGLWLSSLPELNRRQIATTIELANKFPDVIEAIIVGNEVLLRGEMSAPELARTIREVKAKVPMRVTYADVWEFWLRHRDVAAAVDFITVHILPYWEDHPIPVDQAARHVGLIRQQVVEAFPDKEIFLGEFGWPSAGRMREGALPSPVNAARVLQEVVAQGKRENYRVNLIEAYDQPWKRKLEGTVGGYWGLYDAYERKAKFIWGAPVSNHPRWRWQAAGGIAFAALVFAAAMAASWRRPSPPTSAWVAVAITAAVSGTLIGWTIRNIPIESLSLIDWIRSLSWGAVALAAPVVGAVAIVTGVRVPNFAHVVGRRDAVPGDPVAFVLGALLIFLVVLAVQGALGLVFNPRYRDFPFTALTGAVVPYVALMTAVPTRRDIRANAETVAAAVLALCAAYIALSETFANWQSLWFCGGLAALALSLLPGRAAPGSQ